MTRFKRRASTALMCGIWAVAFSASGVAAASHPAGEERIKQEVAACFDMLLQAENRHDLPATRRLFLKSDDTLFVGKAPPGSDEYWTGFWGAAAPEQIGALWTSGAFNIVPRGEMRTVVLGRDVVETYAPVTITVAYAGQSGTPKPFVLVLNWVRRRSAWKITADIAIPTAH